MSDTRWWETFPWRMVQTNLREIDMADMDAKSYVDELKQYHATVVTLNAAGIIASYPTDVGRILRTFKIKKNVEVTDNGKIII